MQHLEVTGAVRHIYVIRRLKILWWQNCTWLHSSIRQIFHSYDQHLENIKGVTL